MAGYGENDRLTTSHLQLSHMSWTVEKKYRVMDNKCMKQSLSSYNNNNDNDNNINNKEE